MHYHQVDVAAAQQALEQTCYDSVRDELLAGLLTVPVGDPAAWSAGMTSSASSTTTPRASWATWSLDRPGRGISKVPDINNVGLMEDRATLRISSQHIANWLRHGIVDRAQVNATFERMAKVVDQQNAGDPNYLPMAGHFDTFVRLPRGVRVGLRGPDPAQRLHRAPAARVPASLQRRPSVTPPGARLPAGARCRAAIFRTIVLNWLA